MVVWVECEEGVFSTEEPEDKIVFDSSYLEEDFKVISGIWRGSRKLVLAPLSMLERSENAVSSRMEPQEYDLLAASGVFVELDQAGINHLKILD